MDRDRELRYILDIDVRSKKVVSWKKDIRENLTKHHPDENIVRIFLTKGQYNKLMDKMRE